MLGGSPSPNPRSEPVRRSKKTRIKQKDKESMLCKCYQLIELCANARQKSVLLRNDFFYQLKINCNYFNILLNMRLKQ